VKGQGTYLGPTGVWTELAGHTHVVLFAFKRNAGESVLDILVGILPQAAVENDTPRRDIFDSEPQPFGPHRIAGIDVIKGTGNLMAEVVVSSGQHYTPPDRFGYN
jgi:hypothetical protein